MTASLKKLAREDGRSETLLLPPVPLLELAAPPATGECVKLSEQINPGSAEMERAAAVEARKPVENSKSGPSIPRLVPGLDGVVSGTLRVR